MYAYKLRPWETALLLALCLTLGAALWADAAGQRLSDRLVRLHVVANSDSPADQAEKLQMRDQVLSLLSPLLRDCATQAEAVDIIQKHRPELEALGDVTVSLGTEYYPAREYPTFSLPAGRYVSLRVVMGAGAGHNWWCVVYPPLCTEALCRESEDAFLPLGEENTALVTQSDEGYELRFHIIDWWGALRERLGYGRGEIGSSGIS